jgi:Photosynthesis system II assembly factor YCF48/Putative zinc-finger
MQDVPQFVLKQLRERAPTGAHPDADLLTAFAEKSLLESERARVMEHLAACGDCRDVLALALPETEIEVSPVSVTPVRTEWLGLPILRWGALAAGLAAVVSVGVLQYSHSRNGDMVASSVPPDAVTLPSASAHPTQPTVSQTEAGDHASSMLGYQASSGQKSAAEIGRTNQAAGHKVVFARPAQSANALAAHSNLTAATSHAKKLPITSEPLEAQRSSVVNSESAAISQNQVAQNESPVLVGGNGTNLTSFDVVKAKAPVPTQAASSNAPSSLAAASPLQTSPSLMLRALPRWTLSSSGVLQRSFDGGNTWENVNPAVSEAQADATNSGQTHSQKAAVPVDPGPVIRAVAAFGAEVWAGGGGGVLYHTSDSGNHWIQITPSTARAGLTGDIVGIQFSDPQHGKISTSNAELWTTSDTGQTWQKQQ